MSSLNSSTTNVDESDRPGGNTSVSLDKLSSAPSMVAMRQACVLSPLLSRSQKLELLSIEARVRMQELNFIREVARKSSESDTERGDSSLEIADHDDSEPDGSSTLSTPSDIELDQVIRITKHETFGVQQQREYSIKPKERLFRRPKVRQYFHNNVLHRSSEELRTSWLEIFVDLLYVGVFCKAGTIIIEEQSWDAFERFLFLMVPLIEHWKAFTQHNNWLYHEDLYHKIHTFLIMTSLMIMGNDLKSAFSSTPETNTSTTYVASFIIARIFIIIVQVVAIVFFNRKFWASAVTFVMMPVLELVPYFALLALPVNGDESRDTLRYSLWWVGTIGIMVLPMLTVAITMYASPAFKVTRIAINIEHTAERLGALYVIALGVVAVSFLYDTQSRTLESVVWVMILALLIGANLNHMYFRSEGGSHYQHALRRVWYTGVLWHFIHYPLVIFTLSLGAIMSAMITSRFDIAGGKEKPMELRADWKNLFFASLGSVYACFLVLRMLHLEHPEEARKDKSAAAATDSSQNDGIPKSKNRLKTRVPNLSSTARLILLFVFTVLLFGVGIGIHEDHWSVDKCFGFGAAVTLASVVLMEWGILKRARKN
ncbi:bacterial low temperature requirement A protein-domain-containing protein [Obelidium mucronatum]|nr:bacterial low temperature requirement A protein-domain-containing protein [Obelidium mucronatum]